MKVFITAIFKSAENREEIEKLCSLVEEAGFDYYCLAMEKVFDNPKELMERAKEEIKGCDFLLIDLTCKAEGRAYEAGIAYALGKPIITILKKGTQIKDTSRGISSIVIEYDKIEDIVIPLKEYYSKISL